MKRPILQIIAAVLLLSLPFFTTAQKLQQQTRPKICGTMEILQNMIRENPGIIEVWKKEGQRLLNTREPKSQPPGISGSEAGEIIIPLVFHLVGSATALNSVPDQDIYRQVERTNMDFAGKSADFYKQVLPAQWASLFGSIPVKFVLARRDPAGNLTTGIERRVTTQTFTVSTLSNLKHTSTGGLDGWDNNKYVNIWCGFFTDGLLGSAFFPYMTPANEQGITLHVYTLGGNTCRSYFPTYDEGKSLSHELGHFFYLYHAWSDDGGACGDADFRVQSGWPLTGLAVTDDTPDEAGGTTTLWGNVSGAFTDNCTQGGIMYMNFMNYFDDKAIFTFSKNQKERVIQTIDLYRSSLKTSDGGIPPSAVTDAYLVNLIPFGKCDSKVIMVNNTPLKAVVRNYGTTTLTSVNLSVSVDGAAPVTTNFALNNLGPGLDTTLNLGPVNSSAGAHKIVVYITSPNGGIDNFLSNDTLSSRITIHNTSINAPFTEGFTAAVPPTGWLINNPQNTTWSITTSTGFAAAGAATVPNYNYNGPGQIDELITPPVNFGTYDSSLLSFQVSYARVSNNTDEWDGLEVLVSGDGGYSYTLAYKKTGDELQTVPDIATTAFDPLTDQAKWRKETVNLTPYIVPGQQMIIRFRNVNAYGNNIYLDDVNVIAANIPLRDAYPISLLNVPPFQCAGSINITPSVIFGTGGANALTSLKINYRIDNGAVTTINWAGSLNKGQTAQVTLGAISNIPPGNHVVTVYTSDPNGLPDLVLSNDTIRLAFVVFGSFPAPLTEGFENTIFPPANWAIANQDGSGTWTRTTVASKSGVASAIINNYIYDARGSNDDLLSPVVTFNGIDSAFLTFELAHATYFYPGSTGLPLDSLMIYITKDCGNTLVPVYAKWGEDLQTVNDPNSPYVNQFIPATPDEWRKETVNLTEAFGTSGSAQLIFRSKGNHGNAIFLDDINIITKTLPATLKENGYMISPNPFSNSFNIRHYMRPTNLRAIQVLNAAGQLVFKQNFNGNAEAFMTINPGNCAAGVYMIRMIYSDKVIIERIVKHN